MQLSDLDLTVVNFHPGNVMLAIADKSRAAVLNELAAQAAFHEGRRLAGEIPAALKEAKADLRAKQADYDTVSAEVDRLAAALRQARADRELIPVEDIAARNEADIAVDKAHRAHQNTQADLDQRHNTRVRNATARVENLSALLQALEAQQPPSTPILDAILSALTEPA